MDRGLYAAASGMLTQQAMQDVLANNIANADTVGYKKDDATFRAFNGMLLHRVSEGGQGPEIGELGLGAGQDQVYTDWQNGTFVHTGNPLDVSLPNGQFFAVQTPLGQRYTRAGDFQRDSSGRLVTSAGDSVLDVNGQAIKSGVQGTWKIDPSGALVINGKVAARLRIVQANPTALSKEGSNLFSAATPAAVRAVTRPAVQTETIEQSNVSAVESMVDMITVTRAFDMAQKALTTQDDVLKQAANDLGKL